MAETHRGAESLASDAHETAMTRAGLIALLGGTGQIGRHVVAELSRRGVEQRVLTRRPARQGEYRASPA